MNQAKRFLDLAARLALRGQGLVEPNPLVGAVIVKNGNILGFGHHRRFGHLHAEREALEDCRRRGHDPRGSTIYVTLEPCRHHGKQPPCTDALIQAGIALVIYAAADPNPEAAGGAELLRQRGIPCDLSKDSRLATGLSAPFIKRTTTGLPWTIAKWAQTIDGRIATRTGESKWISGEPARARVHRLRARVDAIITGIGTVLADDPLLTARVGHNPRRTAKRVIADAHLDLPIDSALVRTAAETPTLVACDAHLLGDPVSQPRRDALRSRGVTILEVPGGKRAGGGNAIDLSVLLQTLAKDHNVATAMIESGPGLLGSLFESDLIDEAVVYIAPMLLGDELAKSVAVGRVAESLTAARRFDLWRVKTLGSDVELTYRRR